MAKAHLPYKRWQELVDVTVRGVPSDGQPGSIVCQHIIDEISAAVRAEHRRTRRRVAPPRRTWYILEELGKAISFDGVVSGVGFNRPELVAPGIKVTQMLGLPRTSRLLRQLRPLLPPPGVRSRRAREAWFEDQSRSDSFDEIASAEDRCEILTRGWTTHLLGIALKHPEAFFENSDECDLPLD